MTSDGDPSGNQPPNSGNVPPFFFQRRNERLDWKKIASLDIDALIQAGDQDQLSEFITPVLFCRADEEIDDKKTDPGFIKVFRICQLIGEYLKFCHEKDSEKLNSVQKELGCLREKYSVAKKELKKTKDMLASTQTQLLGSDNLDEIDQCPYCPKCFLSPSLLLAHLHRRHQGLPIPVSLQAQNIASNVMFPVHNVLPECFSSTNFSPKRMEMQTNTNVPGFVSPTVYAFTLNPDGSLLNQNHDNCNNTQNSKAVGDSEDLRQGFLTEIKLCFSTTSATSVTSSSAIVRPTSSTDSRVVAGMLTPPPESLKSRESRGEGEITNIKSMNDEYQEISKGNMAKSENRSESRSRVGEAGAQMQEDRNDNENKDIKEGESVTHIFQRIDKSTSMKNVATQNEMVRFSDKDEATQTPDKLPILASQSPTSCKSIGIQTLSNYNSDEKKHKSSSPIPSPKQLSPEQRPRSRPKSRPESPANVQNSELTDYSFSTSAEEYIQGILHTDGEDSYDHGDVPASKNLNQDPSGDGDSLASNVDDIIADYDVSDEDSKATGVTGSKINTRPQLKAQSPKRKYVFDPVQGKLINACETKSQIDLVRDRVVQDELDVQMENLGIDPEASTLGIEEMGRALQNLKARRGMMNENRAKFETELTSLKGQVNYEVTKTGLAQDVEKYVTMNRKPETNAFTSMLSKVKKSGVSWRQKVATAIKSRQESKQSPPNPETKTTFFSKWGRRKKQVNKGSTDQIQNEHLNHNESDEDDSSSSELPSHPYMTRSRPILRQGTERKPRKRSRTESHDHDWDSVSDSEDENDSTNENLVVGPGPMTKPIPNIFHSSPTPKSNRHLKQDPFQYQPQPISPIPRKHHSPPNLKPKPKPRPDKGKAPPPPSSNQTSTRESYENLMSELKTKMSTTANEEIEGFNKPTFVPLKGADSSSSATSVSTTFRGRVATSRGKMEDKRGRPSNRGRQLDKKPSRNSWDSSD